jgi:hypothetical protein
MYTQEEKLPIYRRIGVTKVVYSLLRQQKQKTKFSMAKIISNLVLTAYGKNKQAKKGEDN